MYHLHTGNSLSRRAKGIKLIQMDDSHMASLLRKSTLLWIRRQAGGNVGHQCTRRQYGDGSFDARSCKPSTETISNPL